MPPSHASATGCKTIARLFLDSRPCSTHSIFQILEYRTPVNLKPQDILVLLKLVARGHEPWSYTSLGVDLGMSPSQLHSAVRRALHAKLAVRKNESILPNIANLEEFLIHGVKYAFPPQQGELTRGVPTAYAAPPLLGRFAGPAEPPPVWPDPEGSVRGQSFAPLYKLAPAAAKKDNALYELLVLVDAIRSGRAREREFAVKELKRRLRAGG
jgi:hypothetical protein